MSRTIDACRDLGLPYIPDINAPDHPPFGIGRLHFTRDNNSHRNSTYHAFLAKELALARQDRLHICTNTLVTKIDIDIVPGGAKVTRGVQVLDSLTGLTKRIRASREVIVCAGPLVSPQILMLR